MMTFTHTHQDLNGKPESSVTVTLYNDGHIHDVMQEFRNFLLAVSFQPENIDNYIEAE